MIYFLFTTFYTTLKKICKKGCSNRFMSVKESEKKESNDEAPLSFMTLYMGELRSFFYARTLSKSAENLNLNFICLPNHFFPIFIFSSHMTTISFVCICKSKKVRKRSEKEEIQLQSQWQWRKYEEFLIFPSVYIKKSFLFFLFTFFMDKNLFTTRFSFANFHFFHVVITIIIAMSREEESDREKMCVCNVTISSYCWCHRSCWVLREWSENWSCCFCRASFKISAMKSNFHFFVASKNRLTQGKWKWKNGFTTAAPHIYNIFNILQKKRFFPCKYSILPMRV
jgi:hypothetical protein